MNAIINPFLRHNTHITENRPLTRSAVLWVQLFIVHIILQLLTKKVNRIYNQSIQIRKKVKQTYEISKKICFFADIANIFLHFTIAKSESRCYNNYYVGLCPVLKYNFKERNVKMKEQLQNIKEQATKALTACTDIKELDALRVKYLGKKGELTAILKSMGKLSPEERPVMGQLANEVRTALEAHITERQSQLKSAMLEMKLKREAVDVTLPGSVTPLGTRHPLNIVLDELKEIFRGMGYTVVDGPEVEETKYVFDMLNTDEGHPARDEQDTFYITDSILLRTQTSSVQIRTMLQNRPPIAIISPGRVYRSDAVDATHSPIFHQCEGLVIDKKITFGDLKGTLETFAKRLYGDDIKLRFRPHHFPYTEPSAEVDLQCFKCKGAGCPLCKGEGWIEMLGSGLVHPQVLINCGIDPNEYSGFAFGIGLERIAMMRYNIDDMRLLYENDLRFLSQF